MAAIPPHSTGTVDRPWDGPATVAALPGGDEALYRYVFAWYDSNGADPNGDGYPDNKGDWKFPHHGPTRGSPAVLPGVRNALARLPGANIPAGDRAGVERHLNGHLNAQ